jgi:actin-related protein
MKKSLLVKVVVAESEKTKKAREKLKQKLDKTDEKLTEKALRDKSQEIAEWIDRHSSDRIPVEKDVSLFDQNRNSAKMSRSVERLAKELAMDLKK